MSSNEKSRRVLHVTLQRPVTLNTSDIQKVFRWQHISAICGTHTFPRLSDFGGLELPCWPLVPKFAGSNPAEAVGFFRAKKILSTPSFGREEKPFVPCRRFTACKRSLNVTWKSGIFRQNSSAISRPNSSSFHY